METAQPPHQPTHPTGERDDLEETHRQLALLQRRIEVEDALERVRTQSMAMHRSDDLAKAAELLYQELKALGITPWSCGYTFLDEETEQGSVWMTNLDGTLSTQMWSLPSTEDPVLHRRYESWKRQEPLLRVELEGEASVEHSRYIARYSPHIEEESLAAVPVRLVYYTANFSQGYLFVITTEPMDIEEEQTLVRFGRVFEQTYTRFLDLKKAEEQAREAQIEAALERVRARAMAMQKSDELGEAAQSLYQEMVGLGITPWASGYIIMDEAQGRMEVWDVVESGLLPLWVLPLDLDTVIRERYLSWKRQESLHCLALDHEATLAHTHAIGPFVSMDLEELLSVLPERIVFYSANFSEGQLLHVTTSRILSEQERILVRFARVFEQAYTRFLDLKKAEEQARQAQIEAALERVRAKAMAMHNSEELEEVIVGIFEGLESLGFDPRLCNLNILNFEQQTGHGRVWSSHYTETGLTTYSYFVPFLDHPLFKRILKAYEQGEPYLTYELGREDRRHLAELLFAEQVIDLSKLTQNLDQFDHLVGTIVFMSQGRVDVWRETALDEDELAVLQRFTKVVDLTYTRFDDLRKAETQAREAKIEAALERVRARTMAMQRSDELRKVISRVFEEFRRLDFDAPGCCLGIFEEATRSSEWWVSTASEIVLPRSYRIPYLEGWPKDWYQTVYNNWKQGTPFFECSFEGEEKRAFDHKLLSETEFGLMGDVEDIVQLERLILSYATLTHGVLEVNTTEPVPEDQVHILQRFANVIDLTYTRFDDLQQAEARAREAVQQASLDRVRAEIASMRTADDLEHITPLIWRELTTLGVPFFRCGVLIVDEAAQIIESFISNPQGESLGSLSVPFDNDPTTFEIVQYWRRQQVFQEHWDRETFVAWTETVRKRGFMQSTDRFAELEATPEHLSLQFVPFTQGMLYIGSSTSLSDEEISVVQRLADAFAVAYARYNDFHLLERKNREVERALNELKTTQSQLIQQEKMASLGELTAGIAHEIKNPLNFINNFAEVNEELAQELREAVAAGEDLREIIDDLEQNARVINQHGKRADGIVHAMMQHASGGSGQREATDINQLVSEHIDLAYHGKRAQVPDLQVEIKRELGVDAVTVEIVPQEIGRVLLNLLGNAFDAVHEHVSKVDGASTPTVTVSTRQIDSQVEIRVQDNGPGIPANIKDKIFEPFFTTKPTGTGTGLGLSLSYDIVTQGHGGTLTVESEEGDGASFIVTLPANQTAADSSV